MGRRDGTWKLRPGSRFFDRQPGEEGMWTQRTISAIEDHVRDRIGPWRGDSDEPAERGPLERLPPKLMVVVASTACFLVGVVVGIVAF